MSWTQTASGIRLDFLNPKPSMIRLHDIALGLSREHRYAGQTSFPYTVAQHSRHVAFAVFEGHGVESAKWALLHDASEAYMKDIPAPLKKLLGPVYMGIEKQLMNVIMERFELPIEMPHEVHIADLRMGETEANELMQPRHPEWLPREGVLPYGPGKFVFCDYSREHDCTLFLQMFDRLFNGPGIESGAV